MAGSIIITGVKSFKDQSGDLTFVSPDATARPVNYWTVPRWWYYGENTIYESCVRLNNSANNDQIYISTSTLFPHLKVEWNGSSYIFDEDNKREYIDRIWITRDSLLREGTDYQVPLRGPIIQIGGSVADISYTIQNGGTSFTLRSVGTVNYTVDWGDGSSLETSTSNTLSHTYASAGTYLVKVNSTSGSYRPKFNSSGDEDQITSIDIGFEDSTGFSNNIERAFSGAQNMTQYSQVAAATSSVSDYENTWENCSGLTSFPLIDTSSATNFHHTWAECSGLTSFPVLDTSNGTNFRGAWTGCTGLTSFPVLNTSSGTSFIVTWRGCSGLTSFPVLDTSNATRFNESWKNCTGLTSFPLINTSSGTSFYAAWNSCSGLTTFPLIDTSSATNVAHAWGSCSGLTSFPLINTSNVTDFSFTWGGTGITSFPTLDTSSGTHFASAWRQCQSLTTFPALNYSSGVQFKDAWISCRNLTTYPANRFDSTGTLLSNAFDNSWKDCALTAQSIENILTSLDTNGGSNVSLGISGGTNANASTWSTDAIIAHTNLINKGWTISETGTPSMSDLEYTISNSGTSFTLRSTGTVNYTVDWGDESSLETSTSNTLAHTYSSSGTYVVKINSNSGATYRPRFDQSGDEDQITSIAVGSEDSTEFGTDIQKAFRGAQNMTKYNQVGAASSSVTNFQATWRDCSGLTGTFPLIDTSSATNLVATWHSCSGITTFPLIDTSSATTLNASWTGCSSLTSFPLIDTSNVSDLSYAWDGCTGLTAFPTIDTSSATVLSSSWKGCTGITTFPALNFSSCTDFRATWMSCASLTTYPANRFDSTGTLISNAFNNSWASCALTAQSIENILTSLDTNGASNITLSLNGGTNASKTTWSTAANTAYNNLITKGWTIAYNS